MKWCGCGRQAARRTSEMLKMLVETCKDQDKRHNQYILEMPIGVDWEGKGDTPGVAGRRGIRVVGNYRGVGGELAEVGGSMSEAASDSGRLEVDIGGVVGSGEMSSRVRGIPEGRGGDLHEGMDVEESRADAQWGET